MLSFLKKCVVFSILTIPMTLWAQSSSPKGLQYLEITTPDNQIVHVLDVDPSELDMISAHANDQVLGREALPEIAKRHRAIAAINGGYFLGDPFTDGLPAGILKINNRWYGIAYRLRGAIGWSNQKPITLMDRVQTKTNVYFDHKKLPVHGLNQPPAQNKAILYSDVWENDLTPLAGGLNIVIQDNHITKVTDVDTLKIPKGGYLYSLGSKIKYANNVLETGNSATVSIEVIPQKQKEHYLDWQKIDNIVGGTPLLIFQGEKVQDYSVERINSGFVKERYARTAIGTLKNGHWLLVIVEQSALTGSPGMSIPELTQFMLEQGCDYALNLDGGGSSTLYVNEKVVNHPEGEDDDDFGWHAVRPIADAILIVPKEATKPIQDPS